MILPEDVVNQFEQIDDKFKQFLINHYNDLTLKNYKKTGVFLTEKELIDDIPIMLKQYIIKQPKMTPKGFWALDPNDFDCFQSFIVNHYDVVDSPTTKFKDLMTLFSKETGIEVPCIWNNKYETLWNKMNIKYEKITFPKCKTGTYYVYLKNKLEQKLIIHKKFDGIIPDIPIYKK
jgi:hypothetical protein